MTFRPEHDIYRRRGSRNLGVAVALVSFIALVFALTVVKVTRGDPMRAFDHKVRQDYIPQEGEAAAKAGAATE